MKVSMYKRVCTRKLTYDRGSVSVCVHVHFAPSNLCVCVCKLVATVLTCVASLIVLWCACWEIPGFSEFLCFCVFISGGNGMVRGFGDILVSISTAKSFKRIRMLRMTTRVTNGVSLLFCGICNFVLTSFFVCVFLIECMPVHGAGFGRAFSFRILHVP